MQVASHSRRFQKQYARLQKIAAIRRVAVRESLIEAPLGPLQHYRIEWFKRVLKFSPIMPRIATLWDNECSFLQSRQ